MVRNTFLSEGTRPRVLSEEWKSEISAGTGVHSPVRILYLSYTGLLEPLGQSQVLQYILKLSGENRITLLTFEKSSTQNACELDIVSKKCREAGIEWHHLNINRKFGSAAKIYKVFRGAFVARRLAVKNGIEIVHARSYVAGMLGIAIKRCINRRFLFDMRGFWPDERVDGKIWKPKSMRYRVFKWIERHLFLEADHIVSLTQAGAREIERFDYFRERKPSISVIPTCTNLDLFKPIRRDGGEASSFTLGYVGSAGSWYLFAEVAQAVRLLFEMHPSACFLVINKGDHDFICTILRECGVDLDRVEVRAVPFREVAEQIARMDAGIFFINPVWSKRASSPTRLGEFLACGKPVLANSGVGDVEETVTETGTGITVDRFDAETLRASLADLIALTKKPDIVARCRRAAEKRYSLEAGVEEYSRIYRLLCNLDPESIAGRSDES